MRNYSIGKAEVGRMRRIGTLSDRQSADRFVAFLASERIIAHRDETSDGDPATFDIWIRQESDVQSARDHLAAFQNDPATGRFAEFKAVAKPAARKKMSAGPNAVSAGRVARGPRIRWLSESALRSSPATLAVLAMMLAGGMLTRFAGPDAGAASEPLVRRLMPPLIAEVPVTDWYRFIAPAILSGSPTLLFVHAVVFFWFGSVLERLVGTYPAAVMWIGWQAVGGAAQWAWWQWMLTSETVWQVEEAVAWFGSPLATGATAMVCGTIAYLTVRPRLDRRLPLRVPAGAPLLMLAALAVASTAWTGSVPVLAGWAGLAAGLLTALVPLSPPAE